MKKMDKKWVILCSAAIASVYGAGYFTTETQASLDQPIRHIAKNIQTGKYVINNRKTTVTANNRGAKDGQTRESTTTPSKSQKVSVYKDGTFTGTGMNRRGSIEVQVTIKKDKITNVAISDFAMHYSERDVIGLPNEVMQKQSAQVDNVSGATYSTEAFADAVQEALHQARNVQG